jgi:hypothetical protein
MVFYDRQYTFDSLGSFSGHSFIKMSNEDKHIRHSHVQMKLRLPQPLTVYVAKLDDTSLPWLAAEGWEISSLQGVSYSGVRQTRHTDWSGELHEDHYGPGAVYQKTFPAGAIELSGNNGGDGSYVMFVANPANPPQPPADDLWAQHLLGGVATDRRKCNNNVDMVYVADQSACQARAIARGHSFYSFRHNGEGQGHKCMSSSHCDDHLDDRTNEWHVYAAPNGAAEYLGCYVDDGHRDLGAMIGGTNSAGTNTFALCRASCGSSRYMSLQYGGECFCADSYGNGAQYVQVADSECGATNEPCLSNSHNCGGTWRQAIYEINPSPWTMVLQYGSSAYAPNAAASGTLNENAKQFAKLSDSVINALPSGGEAAYDYYMLTSESATANARDTLFMRVQGAYNDNSVTLGFSSWEVCNAASFEACTSWSVAQGGTHGIDTYYPAATNNCDRWFTGYQNSILCYPDQGSGGRCWATGNTCSIGSHAMRQDVKMYKLTA